MRLKQLDGGACKARASSESESGACVLAKVSKRSRVRPAVFTSINFTLCTEGLHDGFFLLGFLDDGSDRLYDFIQRRTREEHAAHAELVQRWDILLGNGAAHHDRNCDARFVQLGHDFLRE